MQAGTKQYGSPLVWDPEQDVTVRAPLAEGAGHWVGAPSTHVEGDAVYLCYRYRRPRGQGRGFEMRIARSTDGYTFTDVFALRREELDSSSIERCALVRTADGYLLYVSYVDPEDGRWRIDALPASTPDGFRADRRVPVLTASQVGLEAVKDPFVLQLHGVYYMFVSCAEVVPSARGMSHEELHASQDVYTTGLVRSQTGLAVSADGLHYRWLGMPLTASPGAWDAYTSRLTCALWTPPVWTVYYDGSRSEQENYEERCGLAVGTALDRIHKVSVDGPALTSPHASGSLRYMDYARLGDRLLFYYEYARPDGSHELRVHAVDLDEGSPSGRKV